MAKKHIVILAKAGTYINIVIFASLVLVNFLGVFMPELGFDALWYHLTLGKLFLLKHQWYFSGGLYYYSAMPRLAELIGLPLLALFGSAGPKFIQFVSGLVSCFLIYRLAKIFTQNKLLSLTAVNLFYATWLVSWQSSSAYVDLVRTVFELSALSCLINTKKFTRRSFSVVWAGLFLGLAIGVKWHALGTLALLAIIFTPLIVPVALIIASPWFLLAYHFTSNPLYPLFEKFMTATQLAQVEPNFYAPLSIARRIVFAPLFLTHPSEDFLSPVIGIVFLLSLPGLLSSNKLIRKIALFGVLGTFLLLLTPPPSTRYFLPYLPAVILSAVYVLSQLRKEITLWIVSIFTLSAFLIFGLRVYAFAKYLPFLTGRLTENQFLTSQSYRLPDTFIDADDYVKNNLPPTANYLISNNLHNLYYFPYDFDHESFAPSGKHYDYLITKNTNPESIKGTLLHTNLIGIQIYKL